MDDFLIWTLYTAKWSSHTGYYSNPALGQDGSRASPIEHRILAWGRLAEVAAAVRRAAFFIWPGKWGGGNPHRVIGNSRAPSGVIPAIGAQIADYGQPPGLGDAVEIAHPATIPPNHPRRRVIGVPPAKSLAAPPNAFLLMGKRR